MVFKPKYRNYKDDSTHRRERINTGFIAFVAGIILGNFGGVFIFLRVPGANAAASQPISAPTLSLPTEAPWQVQTTVATVTPFQKTTEDATEQVATLTRAETSVLGKQLYITVSAESEARFSVYETFPEGKAIGRTQDAAGDPIIDFSNPLNSQLGIIWINLGTLRTGDPDRDNSIRYCVLLTARDEYEFSDCVPTSIDFIPNQIEIGTTIPIQISGNLTLRGNTAPVVVTVNLNVVSPQKVEGFATAQGNRSDFVILNDSDNEFDYYGVEEEVTLEIEFVAMAVHKNESNDLIRLFPRSSY